MVYCAYMVRRCHAEVDLVLRNNAATKKKLGIIKFSAGLISAQPS
jgi:hypothetical protein